MGVLIAPTEAEQRIIDRYNQRLAIASSRPVGSPPACFLCGAEGKPLVLGAVPGPGDASIGQAVVPAVVKRGQSVCRPCKRKFAEAEERGQ